METIMKTDPMSGFKSRQRKTWTMGNLGALFQGFAPVPECQAGSLHPHRDGTREYPPAPQPGCNEMDEEFGEYLHDNTGAQEYLLTRTIKV
jgi:hypothetical protein